MSMGVMKLVIWGALAMSSWVAGLFFLRFWRSSRDRLFVCMAVAFWLLGINWLSLALMHWIPETRHQAYILRLLAFVLIIAGVVDKNRRAVVAPALRGRR
ncbi:MAG: DUF5985 family protein [Deltaproteobacteria bacterium]|nr:DUF5985 family protein [Deltaproteobacteria bacterium]